MTDVRMPDGVVVRFPDDMQPEQIKTMIATKFPDFATSVRPVAAVAAPRIPDEEPAEVAPPEDESWGDYALRKAGVVGRGAVRGAMTGAASLVTLPWDAAENAGRAINRNVLGNETSPYGMDATANVAAAGDYLADQAGLAEPVTPSDRILSAITEGVASIPAGMGVGAAASGLGKAGRLAESVLTKAPATQAVAAGTAGGVSQGVMEATDNPYLAAGAGLVAGVAGGAPIAAGQVGRQTVRPFTQGGREKIVSGLMRERFESPEDAIRRLGDVPEYVPGSQATTAEAAGDIGGQRLQRGLERDPRTGAAFAEQRIANNNARQAFLDKAIPSEEGIGADWDALRAREGAAMGDMATMDTAVDAAPFFDKLAELRQQKERGRGGVRKGLDFAEKELRGLMGEDGSVTLADLRAVRQNIGDLFESADFKQSNPNAKLEYRYVRPLQLAIDDMIEAEAPGWIATQQKFAAGAKELDQLGTMQRIRTKATSTEGVPGDLNDRRQLNAATLRREFEGAAKKMDVGQLRPEQKAVFDTVIKDLDRAGQPEGRYSRSAGSNTAQDALSSLSTGAFIVKALGDGRTNAAARTALAPLSWLYKLGKTDEQIMDMLADAMLDPRVGLMMMQKTTPETVTSVAGELRRLVQAGAAGARTSATQAAADDERPKITIGARGSQ